MSIPNNGQSSDHQPNWDLLWEIPLAVLSWLFFHLNKTIIASLYQLYLNRSLSKEVTWLVLSGENMKIPIILPVLLTKGPRWNTHAVIGTLGPFSVSDSIRVQTATAHRSAASWTVVVYRYPDFKTWTQLSSLTNDQQQEWSAISLPAGKYSLGVRYYGISEMASMPAIRIDPELDTSRTIKGVPVSQSINKFYSTLAERTTLYAYALHYYVQTMLRLRSLLPESFVRQEYLPVGDPETIFVYDWFPAGSSLRVHASQQTLKDHWIYLTAYNRASLPIWSQEIREPDGATPSLAAAGFYLLRVRPKHAESSPFHPEDLSVIRQHTPSSGSPEPAA